MPESRLRSPAHLCYYAQSLGTLFTAGESTIVQSMSPAKVGALASAYLLWLENDDQRSTAWLRVSRAVAEGTQRGSHQYALGHEILKGIQWQIATLAARDIWDGLAMEAAEDVVKERESPASQHAYGMLSVIMANPSE